MKSLRRSLNGKDQNPPPISGPITMLPSISRPNEKGQPPKKVIRALGGYKSAAPQELSFSKGDFFHVIRDPDEASNWYEANNPVTGARGLVPKNLFEEFSKGNAATRAGPPANPRSTASPPPTKPVQSQNPASPRLKTFFATVLHDFTAERPDELDAKVGDNITIVAQSNKEWFVAKPIGRLGRPGLIPVSFVELRDPGTGNIFSEQQVASIMERGEIPKVEEWKKAMMSYKAASIPLGVIDDSTISPVVASPYAPPNPAEKVQRAPEPPSRSSPETATSTTVDYTQDQEPVTSFELLPFGILTSAEVISFHFENDDFWFRINAVWQPLDQRTLAPYTNPLRLILFRIYDDFYDFQIQLLATFPVEAGRSPSANGSAARILPFMPGPVDQVDDIVTSLRQEELDNYLSQLCSLTQVGADYILRHELVRGFFSCKPGDVQTQIGEAGDDLDDRNQLSQKLEDLSVTPETARQNRGSGYGSYPDERPYRNTSERERERDRGDDGYRAAAYADGEETPSPTYVAPLNTSRARSGSIANNPPISSTNNQTAFIKIKIFDRTSDDLIAIRVSPRVSLRQLLEKVRDRLGGDVSQLNYRNSLNTGFVSISRDDDLRAWLEETDKHVLYAE